MIRYAIPFVVVAFTGCSTITDVFPTRAGTGGIGSVTNGSAARGQSPVGGQIMFLPAHDRNRRYRLGLAVKLKKDRAKVRYRRFEPRRRDRRGAVEDRLQAGNIEVVKARMIQDCANHRWHHQHAGDPMAFDERKDSDDVEASFHI